MVNYDVDTEPRLRIYVGLVLASSFLAPVIAESLKKLPQQSQAWSEGAEPFVTPFVVEHLLNPLFGLAEAVSPFVTSFALFGLLLLVFDKWGVWHWPLIRKLSGIPYLGGTWEGKLRGPSPADAERDITCYIRQTWRQIEFTFEGPPIPEEEPAPHNHGTRSNILTAGMFVKTRENIHVRYIFNVRPMTLLDPDNPNYRPSEGTAVLYLLQEAESMGRPWWRRWFGADKKFLKGTYYVDDGRRGNFRLEYQPANRWWERAWDWLRQ
jgi:hypothetical protein